MLKQVFFAIFLLIGYSSFAQQTPETIPFVAYWNKGDSFNYRVTKIEQRWEDNKIMTDDTSSYDAYFKVLDSTKSGYKIKWSSVQDLSAIGIGTEISKNNALPTEIIYSTSETGVFLQLENWDELSKKINEHSISVSNTIEDINSRKKFLNIIKTITSKEVFTQLFCKEIIYFHFPLGAEFPTDSTIHYADTSTSAFGDIIKSNNKYYFEDIDTDNEICTLIHECVINETDSKSMVNSLLQSMDMKGDYSSLNSRLEITDTNRFEYYYSFGLPSYIECTRNGNIYINDKVIKKVNTITIELTGL